MKRSDNEVGYRWWVDKSDIFTEVEWISNSMYFFFLCPSAIYFFPRSTSHHQFWSKNANAFTFCEEIYNIWSTLSMHPFLWSDCINTVIDMREMGKTVIHQLKNICLLKCPRSNVYLLFCQKHTINWTNSRNKLLCHWIGVFLIIGFLYGEKRACTFITCSQNMCIDRSKEQNQLQIKCTQVQRENIQTHELSIAVSG